MCVNYYSYLTTNQADSQPGWAKKDVVKNYFSKLFK